VACGHGGTIAGTGKRYTEEQIIAMLDDGGARARRVVSRTLEQAGFTPDPVVG
jgi:hypothetical protein